MFKIKKGLSLPFLLSALFTSCNPFTTKQEQDFSKLIVGGFKTIQGAAQEGERAKLYNYFIYLKFNLKNENFEIEENFSYDLEIDLNSTELENYSVDDNCGFYDVGDKFKSLKSFSSYSGIEKFLEDDNYVSVFTSIGKYNERNRIVSKKFKITNSGYIYSFSSISSDLEALKVNYEIVYSEKLYLFDSIKFKEIEV